MSADWFRVFDTAKVVGSVLPHRLTLSGAQFPIFMEVAPRREAV